MSLRQLSPLGPRRFTTPKPPAPPSRESKAEPGEEKESHLGRKLLAAGALGLTGLSVAAGGATYAASHLPVCEGQQQIVGWENGSACVSMDVALKGATAWRYLPAAFHVDDAMHTWQSGHNLVLNGDAHGGQTAGDELKVVSWNLHHGQSQDVTGARPQLDDIIDKLQEQHADVYLLQEVAPQHAERLAEELGMRAYFAASTPVQGNMILLDPSIHVSGDSVAVTTGQPPGQGFDTLKEWILHGGGQGEPRNIQVLDVELPGGQSAVIWNTHNLTSDYSPEMQQRAADIAVAEIQKHVDPGEIVLGGGDLNTSHGDHPLIAGLRELPIQGQHSNIDWLYSSRGVPLEFQSERAQTGDGVMLSDHVMVRGTVNLSATTPP